MTCVLTFNLDNEAQTIKFGQCLAHAAKTGDIFALNGTLGMGKSTLARAFIQELTNAEEVPSPTFTLLQTYDAPDFEIYHFDLYRLKNPDEVFEIGIEDAFYNGVSLIEWPERMGDYLPKNAFIIEITPLKQGRCLTIKAENPTQQSRMQNLLGLI